MGTGNKKNPSLLRVSDLYETTVCPLARIMRKECRRRGIDRLKVVWSPEEPVQSFTDPEDGPDPSVPGSTAFVPAVAGLLLAAEVVNDLIRES
ncbi:MAG: tRNA threonylcarbamoyladenosine dehydratase, partial [Oscillospiraceae bacterium]|nr:tRNA threonylcarbamoyladenosine dehydratase [Oscillospiraceae bacterium]